MNVIYSLNANSDMRGLLTLSIIVDNRSINNLFVCLSVTDKSYMVK